MAGVLTERRRTMPNSIDFISNLTTLIYLHYPERRFAHSIFIVLLLPLGASYGP